MKKTNIVGRLALAAVALALTLGACQKEENTSDTPGGELKTLRIEVENQGTGGSKMETEGLQVHWSAGDQVGIKYQNYPVLFSGGSAGVGNVNTNSYSIGGVSYGCKCNKISSVAGIGKAFNAYFPPSIANYDVEYDENSYYLQDTYNDNDPFITLTLPSRYESAFTGGRQQIDLPMVGTYFYCADGYYISTSWITPPGGSSSPEYVALGREVLRFQHLTAALLVKVRNDSGQPLLLDRVALTSDHYRLSGPVSTRIAVSSGRTTEGFAPANIYRSVSVFPSTAAIDDEKQVEVVFPEPVEVAPGGILPVQVPILPQGPSVTNQTPSVITVRVEGRNESIPGAVGSRRLTFQHPVEITGGLYRNTMKTIQIKMDPASPRVTSTAPAFSIDAGNKVLFSKGNLQYNKATSTWSFMEHQWSTVETHGQNVGENYADQDIVSLFGWGTSGHDYGPANYQPWSTSTTGTYGPGSSVLSPTGQSDWGCNAITNGGNTASSGWFTLSRAQWAYLLGDTPERSGRHTLATVNNVPGLLLLPDDWDLTGFSFQASYSDAEWAGMEADGAVFLPAAGMRSGTTVTRVPESAPSTYWTSDPAGNYHAGALFIVPSPGVFVQQDNHERGSAVRLVRYAQ